MNIMTPEEAIEAARFARLQKSIESEFRKETIQYELRKAREGKPIRAGTLMPKTANRFWVGFSNFGSGKNGDVLSSQIYSITRPSICFQEETGMEMFGLPDNPPTWIPITLVLRDDVMNIAHSEVLTQIYKQLKGKDDPFVLILQMLDGSHTVLEELHLTNCSILNYSTRELAYDCDEVVTIHLTVKYDLSLERYLK